MVLVTILILWTSCTIHLGRFNNYLLSIDYFIGNIWHMLIYCIEKCASLANGHIVAFFYWRFFPSRLRWIFILDCTHSLFSPLEREEEHEMHIKSNNAIKIWTEIMQNLRLINTRTRKIKKLNITCVYYSLLTCNPLPLMSCSIHLWQ